MKKICIFEGSNKQKIYQMKTTIQRIIEIPIDELKMKTQKKTGDNIKKINVVCAVEKSGRTRKWFIILQTEIL